MYSFSETFPTFTLGDAIPPTYISRPMSGTETATELSNTLIVSTPNYLTDLLSNNTFRWTSCKLQSAGSAFEMVDARCGELIDETLPLLWLSWPRPDKLLLI